MPQIPRVPTEIARDNNKRGLLRVAALKDRGGSIDRGGVAEAFFEELNEHDSAVVHAHLEFILEWHEQDRLITVVIIPPAVSKPRDQGTTSSKSNSFNLAESL